MKYEPLTATEHFKILAFLLLSIPSLLFMVGIVPVISLAVGFYLMKKNSDFSSIEVSVKAFSILWILIVATILVLIIGEEIVLKLSYRMPSSADVEKVIVTAASLIAALITHLLMVKHLYLIPLRNHSEWVIANGVFSKSPRGAPQTNQKSHIDILKNEKLKQYSVADELVKWAKLKEDGVVSQDEFDEARSKLLNRS